MPVSKTIHDELKRKLAKASYEHALHDAIVLRDQLADCPNIVNCCEPHRGPSKQHPTDDNAKAIRTEHVCGYGS